MHATWLQARHAWNSLCRASCQLPFLVGMGCVAGPRATTIGATHTAVTLIWEIPMRLTPVSTTLGTKVCLNDVGNIGTCWEVHSNHSNIFVMDSSKRTCQPSSEDSEGQRYVKQERSRIEPGVHIIGYAFDCSLCTLKEVPDGLKVACLSICIIWLCTYG